MRINGKPDAAAYRLFRDLGKGQPESASNRGLQSDALKLSASGRKLAGKLVIRNSIIATKDMDSVNSLSDPSMRQIGKSLIEVREILEEMKTLTETALDTKLSRNKRIDLQIEMVELQARLHQKIYNMGMSIAQPEHAGSFIDSNILEQRDRIVIFLKKMQGEGFGSIEERCNNPYDNPNSNPQGALSAIFRYHTTDFELDENGFLKMRDDLFNNASEYLIASLESTLSSFSNQLFPKGDRTDEETLKDLRLSLLDSGNAVKSAAAIQEQLDAFTAIEAEFNRLATADPTVTHNYDNNGKSGQGGFQTLLGLMKYRSEDADGIPKDPLDIRLTETNDPIGKLFMKIDAVLKDKIYGSVGMGDIRKKEQKPKGINPEQLAIIEEARARQHAMIVVNEERQKESPLPTLDSQSAATKTL